MSKITREQRTDTDGNPITVYYREIGGKLVYRYTEDSAPWLYLHGGGSLGRFDTVADLESALKGVLTV